MPTTLLDPDSDEEYWEQKRRDLEALASQVAPWEAEWFEEWNHEPSRPADH